MEHRLAEEYQDRLVDQRLQSESGETHDNKNNIDDDSDDADLSDSEILQQLEDDIEKNQFLDGYREKRLEQLSKDLSRTRKKLTEDPDAGFLVHVSSEATLMNLAASAKSTVIHFYQDQFKTCLVLNNKLLALARKHPSTKFVFIDATNCAFLIDRLKIKVLPCLLSYVNGKEVGRLIGLDKLQYDPKTNDFDIALLEHYLYSVYVLEKRSININSVGKSQLSRLGQGNNEANNGGNNDSDDDFFD